MDEENAPAWLRDLPISVLQRRLQRGLRCKVGPFVVCFQGQERSLAERFHAHYPNYPLVDENRFADVKLQIRRNPTLGRQRWTTRAISLEDGRVFTTFPVAATLAHIEWSMNWAVANRSHHFLSLHAGVMANEHGALILPANPGAGKSTLCAYLMHRGWRLLSDEFTLLRDANLAVHPFPRLIPLKNRSIDVIRELVPEAHLAPPIPGTHKGTISHLRPPDVHLRAMHETAVPRLMIFPKYTAGAKLSISPAARADCFVQITQNSFNYTLRGEEGFRMAVALTERVQPYRLEYSDLPEAAQAIDALMQEAAA